MHASVPSDTQQQDTYFVVAHFHYVLVGGALMGIFSGIYFWWPKAYGYLLNEKLGKINFWLMFIGMNLQFGPQHWLGMNGMPRRIYTYAENMGWEPSNMVASVGGFVLDEEEIKNMKPIKPDEKDAGENHGIHLPDLSYYPLILAAGVTILAVGMMTHFSVIVLGGIGIFWGAIGWSLEPVNDPESH